jgi:hypothetical protein
MQQLSGSFALFSRTLFAPAPIRSARDRSHNSAIRASRWIAHWCRSASAFEIAAECAEQVVADAGAIAPGYHFRDLPQIA